MQDGLMSLMSARRGHYRLESGHHADMWLDLDTLFVHPARLKPFAQILALKLAAHDLDGLVGPAVGGAFLAQMIAIELDIDFVHAERTVAPVPEQMYSAEYHVPERLRKWMGGKRVAIVDDVINAGSAVRSTHLDLSSCGAKVTAVGALLVLGYAAPNYCASQKLPLESVAQLPSHIWTPNDCPLCVANVPIEKPEGT